MSNPIPVDYKTFGDAIKDVRATLKTSYFMRLFTRFPLSELETLGMMASNEFGYHAYEPLPITGAVEVIGASGNTIVFFSREVYDARRSGFNWTPETPKKDIMNYLKAKFTKEGNAEGVAAAEAALAELASSDCAN